MKRSSASRPSGSRARKVSATTVSSDSPSSSSNDRFLFLSSDEPLPLELAEILPAWGAGSVWEQTPARWRVYPGPGFSLPTDFAKRYPGVRAAWQEEERVDWAAKYQASLRPFPVGRRFVVLPAEGMENPWPQRTALRLVPGGAFGTGDHFTTASCLRAFEELASVPASALDAGCGTGILAVAAKLGGVKEVSGFDIDPEAVRVARETAEANGVDIPFVEGGVEASSGAYELVFANLLAETLVENMGELARRLAPGGSLIGSGIAFEKADPVLRAAEEQGLALEEMRTDATWWTFRWIRQPLCV